MRDLAHRIAQLSPVKRALLARRIRQREGEAAGAARDAVLVAYVAAKDGEAPSTADLRAFLQPKLPDYLLPSTFVWLDALPRTPNGKVDRRALPAPNPPTLEAGPAYTPPRTPREETLAALWADALGVERIGVHDNFFEIGGHSLLAIQLLGYVRERFQVDVPMSVLFEAPTIAAMAEHLETLQWAAGHTGADAATASREEIEL